jgi:uncharacterized protein
MRPAAYLYVLIGTFAPALPVARAQTAPPPAPVKRLLFLTHAALYKHKSLGPAERAVTELGKQGGFAVTTLAGYTQDAGKIDLSFVSADYLAPFDGVMFMTNGNLPLDDQQRRALIDFVRGGKAFIGVHCAALTFYDDPEFGEMLGGYFRRTVNPKAQVVVLKVEDPAHPATRMLGPSWPLADEFYHFGTAAWDPARPRENVDVLFGNRIPVGFSRNRVHVLLGIDTERTDLKNLSETTKGGDYPQAWCRDFGKGRSFYTALGHAETLWSNDLVFRSHILGGIRWALGLEN